MLCSKGKTRILTGDFFWYARAMGVACSICSAPSVVQAAIDEALSKKENLRDLARRSGFSRAGLSRHNRKCLRAAALADFARMRLNASGKIHVYFPPQAVPAAAQNDWIVEVTYDPPKEKTAAPEPNKTAQESLAAFESTFELSEPTGSEIVAQPPPEPQSLPLQETSQPSCVHEMKLVSAGLFRCMHCGHQKQEEFVAGFSKAETAKMRKSRLD